MTDPIVDAPVMEAKLTTYSEVQKSLDNPPPVAPITDIVSHADVPPVDAPPADTPPIDTPPSDTPPVDADPNVTAFKIGDDTPPPSPEAVKPDAKPTVFNIDEEIKKLDRKELLKKAGVSEFAIEIDEHISKGGSAEDYISAKSIDYNKVSDEDLVKSDLRKEYPGFSAEDIDELFLAKYKDIDSTDDTDPDRKRAELQLRADAFKARQSKIQEQQKFKIPETPILQKDEAYEQWKQEQESQSKLKELGNNWFLQHEATKSLNESKRVTIDLGEGVEPFNFDVDRPDLLTKAMIDDGETYHKLTTTKTGEPDVKKQQLVNLFTYNPQQFIKDIFRYGVQMGERKPVVEGQNASKPQAKVASIDPNATPTYKVSKYGG